MSHLVSLNLWANTAVLKLAGNGAHFRMVLDILQNISFLPAGNNASCYGFIFIFSLFLFFLLHMTWFVHCFLQQTFCLQDKKNSIHRFASLIHNSLPFTKADIQNCNVLSV